MMDLVIHEGSGRLRVSALLSRQGVGGVCILVLTTHWSLVHLR